MRVWYSAKLPVIHNIRRIHVLHNNTMSKKRTIDAFFAPPAKQRRVENSKKLEEKEPVSHITTPGP